MKEVSVKINDILEVATERLAYGGDAVAHHEGLAIFIPFAAPNERLRIRITERKKNFARAVIDRILEPSPARREPPCQYFGNCGGCQLQHLNYKTQLESKVAFVRDALERIGRVDWPQEINIIHGDEFGYRGRAQIQIDSQTHRIGFRRAASHAVCDVESCLILEPELNEALAAVRSALTENRDVPGLSQVDMAAGESGVSFEPSLGDLPGGLLQRKVSGAVYNFNASTFFQANPRLLEELINDATDQDSGELAIDLYAGVGLFTIQLARRFKQVIGIESDSRTAELLIRNLVANGVTNVEVHTGYVDSWLKRLAETEAPPPDLLLLDPPRSGAAEAIPYIVALKPKRITYVSCDPTTLARDLRPLIDSGYELSRVTAIDMFPQTYHVETVAALKLEAAIV